MSDKGFRTEQESFWAGAFGDQYISRNQDARLLASNIAFFSRALGKTSRINSCLEIGANVGMNLRALAALYPGQTQYAVEINHQAANELRKLLPESRVFESSVLDLDLTAAVGENYCDLIFTKGVLIHVRPEFLGAVYEKMFAVAKRYVLVCEYYNPVPVTVEYRGHAERLYKRDFAGEMMAKYPSLELLDYGFAYRRDRAFPQDDITWFLMEKPAAEAKA
jgi:spore coat polysaccharide biosynthesis protein SpsF